MSMDQRHREIRERAGREEARLNQEFIEFLKKWGTPILMVAAALSLGYVGLDYMKKQRAAKVDAAFKDLQAVSLGGALAASPDSLLNVASTHSGVAGVLNMARLGAGDSFLQAVRSGLRPGAVLKADGTPEIAEDILTDADRTSYLERAADAYGSVLRDTENSKGQEVHAIGALYGLAAVEEARGQRDAAKVHLEKVKAIADRMGFVLHSKIAAKRIESIDSSEGVPTLVSQSELPAPPAPPDLPVPIVPEPAPGDTGGTDAAPTGGDAPAADGSPATAPAGDTPADQTPDAGEVAPASSEEPKPDAAPATEPK